MKHWVFDLDGTIVDSLTVHFQILEKIFLKFNQPFSKKNHNELLKVTSKTLPNYFEFQFGLENVESALEMFSDLTNAALKSIKPFTGIEELLKTLKSKGSLLAVWTARDLAATQKILQYTGLESYFSICISGCCTTQGKPHPEGLQKIANHFESDSSEMVMVGDFDSDMLGAQVFGTKAIRVLWHPSVEYKKCEIANWQFSKVSDFQNWIDNSFKD